MTFLAVLLVVVVAIVAGVAVVAVRQKKSFARANEVVPGRATTAPAAWAGSHSTEAKLHRRIIDAVSALRANDTLSDAAFMDSRASIEQIAVATDERLIAAAALPASHRVTAIDAVEPAVAALESAVAMMAAPGSGGADHRALDDAVRAAQTRLDALASARTELDALDPTINPIPDVQLPQPVEQNRNPPPTEGGTPASR